MVRFARFTFFAAMCALSALLSSPEAAIACKADYCNGPNGNQPPPPTPPPPQTGLIPCFPNDANGLQAARIYADNNMSAAQLYTIFLQLNSIFDGLAWEFNDQLANNGLQLQIINNMFGGNVNSYNIWINQVGGGDGTGSVFHFNSGDWSYYDPFNNNLITGNLAGWSSC